MVHELLERGIDGQELLEIVEFLTGLPPIRAMQLIACDQGVDIRDAVGMPNEILALPHTS